MDEKQIAEKYVHGNHNALTDSQEKIDMANDILEFAEEYHKKKTKSVFTHTMRLNDKGCSKPSKVTLFWRDKHGNWYDENLKPLDKTPTNG